MTDPQFADFVIAVCKRQDSYLSDKYKSTWGGYRTKGGLAESSGTTGGYTVPAVMAAPILDSLAALSILHAGGATAIPYQGKTLQLPMPDISTPRVAGTPPWTGGLRFTWTPESQIRAETEPAFKMMELSKNELSGDLVISRPLYNDGEGGPVAAYLGGLIGRAVAWMEDYAFFQGDGAGQPAGILNSKAAISVPRSFGGAFKPEDAQNMIGKLPPGGLRALRVGDEPQRLAGPDILPRMGAQRSAGTPRTAGTHHRRSPAARHAG